MKKTKSAKVAWLNSTVIGAAITSFLGDLSYESVTALLPSFLISIGAPVYALGLIEGISDGLSSFTKLLSGYYSDMLGNWRELAVFGYILNGLFPLLTAIASSWLVVLLGKSIAWLGKGLRGPPRDAILADAVDEQDLGRAFGFHRAADTMGAVLGPIAALVLFAALGFRGIFFLAAIVGLAGAASFWLLVKSSGSKKLRRKATLFASITSVPAKFKSFLRGVFVFGLADFSPALLVLLAVSKLSPSMGLIAATTVGVLLYTVRNITYAAFSYPFGWLGDKFGRKKMLVVGYGFAVLTFVGFIIAPVNLVAYALLFALAGVFVAAEDALEGSVAAELTPKSERGTSFGVLATANGVGDLVSSSFVGLLWTYYGFNSGLEYSAILAALGTVLLFFTV